MAVIQRTGQTLSLLVTQANAVHERVVAAGLSPSDFAWDTTASPIVSGRKIDRLLFKPAGYFFAFDKRTDALDFYAQRVSLFSPGPEDKHTRADSFTFEQQLEVVSIWLHLVKREHTAVNLWELADEEPVRDMVAGTFGDRRLNDEQRREVKARLTQVRVYLRSTVGPDPQRIRLIEEKLNEIEEASQKLGVKDFANASLGAIVGLAFQAALTSDQAQHVIQLFFTGLRHLIGS
jgi:hypothetical protein